MNLETPDDYVAWQLEGIHQFEQQLVEVLGWLAEEAAVEALDDRPDEGARTALVETFHDHRDQTRDHVERLDDAFETLDHRPRGREVPSVDGLVTEAERFTNIVLNDELRGPYFVETGIRFERLEITAYEHAIAMGDRLGLGPDVTDPLEANLAEEEATLEELQDHAQRMIARLAAP